MAFALVACYGTGTPAQTTMPADVRLSAVTDQKIIDSIIDSLQQNLSDSGQNGRISGCSLIIDYVQPMPSGKDSSYGAICTIVVGQMRKDWLMCDDWMIGKFTITDTFAPTKESIGAFIAQHCPPGG